MRRTSTPETSFKVEPVGRSGSLASNVADQLETMIAQSQIDVGQKLPTENKLCEMFNVSRTVVREAITQLKSLGLVETRRGVGTTVLRSQPAESSNGYQINPSAVEDILHILEFRMSVEVNATKAAAQRRSEADVDALESALVAFDNALKVDGMAREADLEFHMAIANATKNPFFQQFFEQFNKNVIPRAQIIDSNSDQTANEDYLRVVQQEHLAIFDAIKAQDPDAAGEAMHKHLSRAYRLYEQLKPGR
ncbi:MAG: FadR/GntR family transcriptional regulator [Pontibacterium sp.]